MTGKTAMMVEAIRCPTHGATMEQRATLHQTPEQKFVGVSWGCWQCGYSVLFASPALRAQYAEMGHTCLERDQDRSTCLKCITFAATHAHKPRHSRRRTNA